MKRCHTTANCNNLAVNKCCNRLILTGPGNLILRDRTAVQHPAFTLVRQSKVLTVQAKLFCSVCRFFRNGSIGRSSRIFGNSSILGAFVVRELYGNHTFLGNITAGNGNLCSTLSNSSNLTLVIYNSHSLIIRGKCKRLGRLFGSGLYIQQLSSTLLIQQNGISIQRHISAGQINVTAQILSIAWNGIRDRRKETNGNINYNTDDSKQQNDRCCDQTTIGLRIILVAILRSILLAVISGLCALLHIRLRETAALYISIACGNITVALHLIGNPLRISGTDRPANGALF